MTYEMTFGTGFRDLPIEVGNVLPKKLRRSVPLVSVVRLERLGRLAPTVSSEDMRLGRGDADLDPGPSLEELLGKPSLSFELVAKDERLKKRRRCLAEEGGVSP